MASRKRDLRACKVCDHMFDKNKAQCPSCLSMNIDEIIDPDKDGTEPLETGDEEKDEIITRIPTGPWDINYGVHIDDDGKEHRGIVDTTVTLIGGKNGSGKSTHCMHMAIAFFRAFGLERPPLYIATEEGKKAIRARAKRLGMTLEERKTLRIIPLGKSGSVDLDQILERRKPRLLIGDSLTKIAPDPKDAVIFCDKIRIYCEELKMPAIMLCHINKEGDYAGFEEMQHSVDAALMFSIGHDKIRELETKKNRNGSDEHRTYYRMTEKGLEHYDISEDDMPDDDEEEEDNDDE